MHLPTRKRLQNKYKEMLQHHKQYDIYHQTQQPISTKKQGRYSRRWQSWTGRYRFHPSPLPGGGLQASLKEGMRTDPTPPQPPRSSPAQHGGIYLLLCKQVMGCISASLVIIKLLSRYRPAAALVCSSITAHAFERREKKLQLFVPRHAREGE